MTSAYLQKFRAVLFSLGVFALYLLQYFLPFDGSVEADGGFYAMLSFVCAVAGFMIALFMRGKTAALALIVLLSATASFFEINHAFAVFPLVLSAWALRHASPAVAELSAGDSEQTVYYMFTFAALQAVAFFCGLFADRNRLQGNPRSARVLVAPFPRTAVILTAVVYIVAVAAWFIWRRFLRKKYVSAERRAGKPGAANTIAAVCFALVIAAFAALDARYLYHVCRVRTLENLQTIVICWSFFLLYAIYSLGRLARQKDSDAARRVVKAARTLRARAEKWI